MPHIWKIGRARAVLETCESRHGERVSTELPRKDVSVIARSQYRQASERNLSIIVQLCYTAPYPGALTRSTPQGRLSGYIRLLKQRLVTIDRLCRHLHALQRPIFLCKVWPPSALCMDLCTLRRVAAYIERFIACRCNRNRFMDLEDRPGTQTAPGLPYTAFVNV